MPSVHDSTNHSILDAQFKPKGSWTVGEFDQCAHLRCPNPGAHLPTGDPLDAYTYARKHWRRIG